MSEHQEIRKGWIGDLVVTMTSDVYLGEVLDTAIATDSGTICVVAGKDRQEFIAAMNAVVEKYRI